MYSNFNVYRNSNQTKRLYSCVRHIILINKCEYSTCAKIASMQHDLIEINLFQKNDVLHIQHLFLFFLSLFEKIIVFTFFVC